MPKFAVGEIADVTNGRSWKECEILGLPPQWGANQYYIHVPGSTGSNGEHEDRWLISECYLRKKKPPEELGDWDEIEKLTNWNPTKEYAEVER